MCIGCKLANKEFKTYTIYETETLHVFLDLYPYNYGHLLILPKEHYESLDDLPHSLACEIMLLSQKLKKTLMSAYNCDDLIIVQNNGSINSLKHYHMHLIPHYQGQDLSTLYDTTAYQDNDEVHLLKSQELIVQQLQNYIP